MRAKSTGPATAALMLAPILAVPMLAIFGIPQFVPLAASPSEPPGGRIEAGSSLPRGSGAASAQVYSDSRSAGRPARPTVAELFASHVEQPPLSASASAARDGWLDPFEHNGALSDPPANETRGGRTVNWAGNRQRASAAPPQPHSLSPELLRDARKRWHDLPIHQPVGSGEPMGANYASYANSARLLHRAAAVPADSVEMAPVVTADYAEFQTSADDSSTPQRFVSRQERPGNRPAASVPSKPLTWSEAVDRLKEFGIRQYQLQPGEREGEFHFSCFFTPEDDPRIRHRFEAEASDPLRAVGNVLAQIENWNRRR